MALKQLTIISGKGGTGKTTITAAFALLADSPVLADADVDAADLHLILAPEMRHREQFTGGSIAAIDAERCTRCGACAAQCRFDAIHDFIVDPIACEGCAVCTHVCPTGAVAMQAQICGEWFVSDTRRGPMVHARLGIAQDNSGKLVSTVRRKACEIATAENRELVLIDGPPGIGCPVIAAITGADMVLVVTEPTPSGLHDMQRVLDTALHFKIPALVCVNKFDINPENSAQIEAVCSRRGVRSAGRIPYDKSVTVAMIAGRSVAEHDCGAVSREVRCLWAEVKQALFPG